MRTGGGAMFTRTPGTTTPTPMLTCAMATSGRSATAKRTRLVRMKPSFGGKTVSHEARKGSASPLRMLRRDSLMHPAGAPGAEVTKDRNHCVIAHARSFMRRLLGIGFIWLGCAAAWLIL